MLDGRVKTLHPKIHAGILHDRQNKIHRNEMSKNKFPSIDLIIVNFYPFQKIVSNTKNSKKIVENIDIGGPTMVRAAAKNHRNVIIVCNPENYSQVVTELRSSGPSGEVSLKFRQQLALTAFEHTASYDSAISDE